VNKITFDRVNGNAGQAHPTTSTLNYPVKLDLEVKQLVVRGGVEDDFTFCGPNSPFSTCRTTVCLTLEVWPDDAADKAKSSTGTALLYALRIQRLDSAWI
jgi:hypothetical protein